MSMFGFFSGLSLGVFITGLCYRVVMADPCIVTIHTNPFIKRMVAIAPRRVACFIGAHNLQPEVLDDFRSEIKSGTADIYDVVENCSELARAKHYKMFALGKDGLCLSGADIQNKYHISGPKGAECEDGIGKGDSMFVYSLDPAPKLQPIGCYDDDLNERALPVLYANLRSSIDWLNMELTVNQCAQVASDIGYEYFGVQFFGECYSGRNAKESYAKYGNITEGCWKFDNQTGFAVGKEGKNFVYRILN